MPRPPKVEISKEVPKSHLSLGDTAAVSCRQSRVTVFRPELSDADEIAVNNAVVADALRRGEFAVLGSLCGVMVECSSLRSLQTIGVQLEDPVDGVEKIFRLPVRDGVINVSDTLAPADNIHLSGPNEYFPNEVEAFDLASKVLTAVCSSNPECARSIRNLGPTFFKQMLDFEDSSR